MSRSHGGNTNPVTGTSRRWCFTLNNPEGLLDESTFSSMGITYCVYQYEMGEETHTPHFQGYIESKSCRFSAFFPELEGAHFIKADGTAQQCIDYCTKSDTRLDGPYMWGTASAGRGTRTDIVELRDAIRGGLRGKALYDDDRVVGAAVKYGRGVNNLIDAYNVNLPRSNVVVTLHYGPAGTGKTHCAHTDEAYYFDGNNGFWNGYQGEKTIILDEFGGHVLTPLMFQRLCDKYPLSCNVKGVQGVPCRGEIIHICSNYLPCQWWSEKTKYNSTAINRRISVVHWHYGYKKYKLYVTDDPQDENTWAMTKLYTALRNLEPFDVNS